MLREVILGIVAAVVLVGAENLIAREKSGKPQGKQKQKGRANGMKLTYSRPATGDTVAHGLVPLNARLALKDGWLIKSSTQVKEDGQVVSTGKFVPENWYPTSVASTVLNALVKNGVYPDPRVGLNNFLIPDASDEFNKKHDLAKYSHLPGKTNPWKDPYWYRTEFRLPETGRGKRVWLNFGAINYRADVWLNGNKIADHKHMAGAFSRYRFEITDHVKAAATNYLAVKIHQVDHPAIPDAQLDVFIGPRDFRKEILKDVALVMSVGYDCMPTVRDRNMGIWQDVYIDFTGPVDIRAPFVVTDLPLPKTSPAHLTVSAELVNTTASPQQGILRGSIVEDGVKFEKRVELAPGETKNVVFSRHEAPQPVINNPRLWWPNNYGEQYLYNLSLSFEVDGKISDQEVVTFGVREITKVLHELDGEHGLRLHINGKKVFCRGGYLQPEMLFDWDAKRIDAEVRYLTEANLNLVYFEDIPNPPEEFANACDKYGLMFGNCYYGCWWMTPGSGYPSDVALLSKGTVDIVKRIRNHPSLILHMAMNEGDTRKDVYEMWRKHVTELDGTRLLIPSGSYPDYRENPPEWVRKDMPVGMNDWLRGKSYGWQKPSQYYRWVRDERGWMFQMECGSASLPPISSLRKFIPDIWNVPEGPHFPLNKTWAHHGANNYYRPYDSAIRRMHGRPRSVEDYCMKGHVVTADQHRAMFEATRHRMWDITSGLTQWKLNSCWPSVQWQIYDWYLRPMVSFYYIKKACEPLHVQLSPIDWIVTVVSDHFEHKRDMQVSARVFDFDTKLRWQKNAKTDVEANTYKDIFAIPVIPDLTDVYFVKLELKDSNGNLVSNNFYWLSSKTPADFTGLQKLPPAKLNISYEIENKGQEAIAHVKVENPTDKLAFFIHLAVTKGPNGEEVLPVFWEDNYFSLLPRESKEVCATFATEELRGVTPIVEVGGWNIRSGYLCTKLQASKEKVKTDEPFTVTADIKNTFIDGSRIELYVDNKVVDSKLLWARARAEREISFTLKLLEPGLHEIKVGTLTTSILVN